MKKIKTVIELSENEIKKLEKLTGNDICEDEDIEDAIRIIIENA